MERVIVIGPSGAGKSTFSRALRDKTGLPLHYLDMLFHKPDKTTVTREEFDAKLAQLLQGEKWIIDGDYNRTLETRLQACDTVFFLDYPLEVCLQGVESRRGKPREDMPWIETEPDPEFIQWIRDFFDIRRPKVLALFEQYREGRTFYIFHSRDEADAYLASL